MAILSKKIADLRGKLTKCTCEKYLSQLILLLSTMNIIKSVKKSLVIFFSDLWSCWVFVIKDKQQIQYGTHWLHFFQSVLTRNWHVYLNNSVAAARPATFLNQLIYMS